MDLVEFSRHEERTASGLLKMTKVLSDLAVPSLVIEHAGAAPSLRASGSWTVAHIDELETLVKAAAPSLREKPIAELNMRDVDALDTYGSLLLIRLIRNEQAGGAPARAVALRQNLKPLFDEVFQTSTSAPPPRRHRDQVSNYFDSIGRGAIKIWDDLFALAAMFGAICTALIYALLNPRRFRLTSAVHQFDRVAWQAVPIILLITFLIGGIIAQQGFFHFRKFGADAYVVDMVGILVLREIGVLIVAIMVAGRSGSSYTAELGSMKMREEIDALQTMGLDPIEVLVLPRIIALVIALPILTFLGSMSALYGGQLVAWFYGGMSPEIFLARLREAISLTHFEVGMIKAPFMALVIGVVACAQGMQVKGSAESLGLQTTASVVKAIFLVIVLDGFFAIFFASIDM